MSPALLTAEQLASRLALKPRTITAMARRGDIPCLVLTRGRDGRAAVVRFDERAVDEWLQARAVGTRKRVRR